MESVAVLYGERACLSEEGGGERHRHAQGWGQRERECPRSFILRSLISFPKVRILGEISGEISGEVLNRLFISFSCVSFQCFGL